MELSDATLIRLIELFRGFPLLPIRTEAELERAQAVVDELLGRERDEAEELYLDVLGIHAYEKRSTSPFLSSQVLNCFAHLLLSGN